MTTQSVPAVHDGHRPGQSVDRQGRLRQPDRHRRRVVRLLPLRLRRRPGLRRRCSSPRSEPVTAAPCSRSGPTRSGFAARPLGGIVFGHFGDRVGRKKMLVVSLLLMGVAHVRDRPAADVRHDRHRRADPAAGLPAAAGLRGRRRVGRRGPDGRRARRRRAAAASGPRGRRPACRWATCSRPACCWSSPPSRATPTSRPGAGGSRSCSPPCWSMIGLWVRLTLEESPVFKEAQAEIAEKKQADSHMPIIEVIKDVPQGGPHRDGHADGGEHLLLHLHRRLAHLRDDYLGVDKDVILKALLIGAAIQFFVVPAIGALSDRVGRRPLYLAGAVGVGVWTFVFFGLIDTQELRQGPARRRRRPVLPLADVRPAGGVLLRAVRHLGALHRRVGGLPAGVDLRRCAGPDHRR